MTKRIQLLIVFFVLSVAGQPALASDYPTEREWLAAALESNAFLAAQLASAEAAAERISGAGTWKDPTVNFLVAPETVGGDDDLGSRIEFSQALPWPGSLDARKSMAEAGAEASRAEYEWARKQLIAEVRSAWAEWWFIHEAIRLHHENQAHVEQLLANAREGYAYGNVQQTDLLQLQRELADLDMQQHELTQQKQSLAAKLEQLLGGRPEYRAVALAPVSRASLPDLNTAVDMALANHPLRVAAQSRLSASRANVEIQDLERYPKVKLMAGYNTLWADEAKRGVIGLGVELPLSGRRQQSALNSAKAEMRARRWEAVEQERRIRAELTQAWEKSRAVAARLDILESEGIPLAEQQWQASLEQLGSLQGGFQEAIEGARSLTRSQLRRARLIADTHRSFAELQRWLDGD